MFNSLARADRAKGQTTSSFVKSFECGFELLKRNFVFWSWTWQKLRVGKNHNVSLLSQINKVQATLFDFLPQRRQKHSPCLHMSICIFACISWHHLLSKIDMWFLCTDELMEIHLNSNIIWSERRAVQAGGERCSSRAPYFCCPPDIAFDICFKRGRPL